MQFNDVTPHVIIFIFTLFSGLIAAIFVEILFCSFIVCLLHVQWCLQVRTHSLFHLPMHVIVYYLSFFSKLSPVSCSSSQ